MINTAPDTTDHHGHNGPGLAPLGIGGPGGPDPGRSGGPGIVPVSMGIDTAGPASVGIYGAAALGRHHSPPTSRREVRP